ncbi:hypothetical protein WA026_018581 [Henosepilachna vigintioctopunctata]|uniref:E3 ubiquitin-protein ligase APD1-4 N-terminal domain-containing protein n=1 Tax=Henosepilachna vigintioctopunctata TaxID=420089 RepID=A0AAW1UBB7_9CUCU
MRANSDYLEVYPLRGAAKLPAVTSRVFKGPTRVVRLCLLGILLPVLLVAVPLYLRYRVYVHQLYPLAMSDMRVIDGRISTTWCQRQMVKANTTFNAFLLPDSPKISDNFETLSMVRHLRLDDDMKEYWGFYLIKGSIVKVSTCVRWQGASLIVIRGHKHLHECAYIGDDSSEEEEEVQELRSDAPANRPSAMRRHRPDVKFLHPASDNQSYLIHHVPETHYEDDSDLEGDIKKLLSSLQEKITISRKSNAKQAADQLNRLSTPKEENSKLTSTEIINDILKKLEKLGSKNGDILEKLSKKLQSREAAYFSSTMEVINRTKREFLLETAELSHSAQEQEDVGAEVDLNPDGIADDKGTVTEDTVHDMSNSEFWSSFSSSEEALLNCAGYH